MEFKRCGFAEGGLKITDGIQNIGGAFADAVSFIENEQLTDDVWWAKFVEQYREMPDAPTLAWRGEYWGKMMRGAVSVFAYTKSEKLYSSLEKTVRDMLTVIASDGRVSTYSRDGEFEGWDIWCRKYVLLGMLYFYDICKCEKLKADILTFCKGHADYILAHIGEGKRDITTASSSWFGINSSSILEPMVWLYHYTGEKRYLDFSTYIVERGGADRVNVFECAYENKLPPYQYGVAKAYELTSCFEGLLAYYYATGIEKYKVAAINYGLAILNSDTSIIGSLGTTHELLDHTTVRQTYQRGGREQETCVTVTWMKYCASIYRLTGDVRFADAIEQSFYNAYLGAINTELRHSGYMRYKFRNNPEMLARLKDSFMPFDSYSPLTPGVRGLAVGGNQVLSDGTYYGCCACIGSVGLGIYASHRLLADNGALVLSFLDDGDAEITLGESRVCVNVSGGYPVGNEVKITVRTNSPAHFALKVRNPAWSESTEVSSDIPYTEDGGFIVFDGEWCGETTVYVTLDMHIRALLPITWERDTVYTDMTGSANGWYFANAEDVYHKPEYDDYISISRGPIVLAADERLGKAADSAFSFSEKNGEISYELCPDLSLGKTTAMLKLRFTSPDGEQFCLADYSSVGKDWKSMIAAWLPTK